MNVLHLSPTRFNLLTPAARRPSLQLMVERLASKGVSIAPYELEGMQGDLKRLNALHQLDFKGEKTAFEHIEALADAKTIKNGDPSSVLAADLFTLLGSARVPEFGRCYARTNHSIYTVHHPGEMARLVRELAMGEVKTVDGTTVKWNPESMPIETAHVDTLWGALNHLLKRKELPENPELEELAWHASKGEMANITSRLMGEPFVNVNGPTALPKLTGIVDQFGPMLAEYGSSHGGSFADIGTYGPRSHEPGSVVPQEMVGYDLGYVVVPAKEAKAQGLTPIDYADHPEGYAASPPPAAKRAVSPVPPADSTEKKP